MSDLPSRCESDVICDVISGVISDMISDVICETRKAAARARAAKSKKQRQRCEVVDPRLREERLAREREKRAALKSRARNDSDVNVRLRLARKIAQRVTRDRLFATTSNAKKRAARLEKGPLRHYRKGLSRSKAQRIRRRERAVRTVTSRQRSHSSVEPAQLSAARMAGAACICREQRTDKWTRSCDEQSKTTWFCQSCNARWQW